MTKESGSGLTTNEPKPISLERGSLCWLMNEGLANHPPTILHWTSAVGEVSYGPKRRILRSVLLSRSTELLDSELTLQCVCVCVGKFNNCENSKKYL